MRTAIPMIAIYAIVCSPTSAKSLLYNFEQADTGVVVATLEVASVPFTHAEIINLALSPVGQDLFGYPKFYPGTFDQTVGSFVSDGIGGLTSVASNVNSLITDFPPPPSSKDPDPLQFQLQVDFESAFRDSIGLEGRGIDNTIAYVVGDWRLVPEPSTTAILALCLTALAFRQIY